MVTLMTQLDKKLDEYVDIFISSYDTISLQDEIKLYDYIKKSITFNMKLKEKINNAHVYPYITYNLIKSKENFLNLLNYPLDDLVTIYDIIVGFNNYQFTSEDLEHVVIKYSEVFDYMCEHYHYSFDDIENAIDILYGLIQSKGVKSYNLLLFIKLYKYQSPEIWDWLYEYNFYEIIEHFVKFYSKYDNIELKPILMQCLIHSLQFYSRHPEYKDHKEFNKKLEKTLVKKVCTKDELNAIKCLYNL